MPLSDLKVKDGGQAEIDWGRVEEEALYHGKWVLRTNPHFPGGEVGLNKPRLILPS